MGNKPGFPLNSIKSKRIILKVKLPTIALLKELTKYKKTVIKTIFILALGVIIVGSALAKKTYHCTVCGKEILTQAAVIDGKFYHPECFVCAACGKPIKDDYVRDKEGKYYHRQCFQEKPQTPICAHCFKPIVEKNYTSYQGKTYHTSCYLNSVAPRCDICGEPLDNAAITDFWGTRFHPRHAREYNICVVCGRLIVRDGKEIEPNRWMCPICNETAVETPEKARELLEVVRDQLASMGIVVKTLGLRIVLVSSEQLREGRRPNANATAHAYAGIKWNKGGDKSGDETAVLRVLSGLPDDLMRGVIAHELMHIWQHENGVDTAPLEYREGSANWASSLIYGHLRNERGRYFIGGLEESNDPYYGTGYREVAKYADNHGIEGVLRMLKQKGIEGAQAKKK